MKIRLTLALLFVVGIGTSVYCTERAPTMNSQPVAACCGSYPELPDPSPTPTPLPGE
jgi:hypothetical protein